jgi:hypothetical protein
MRGSPTFSLMLGSKYLLLFTASCGSACDIICYWDRALVYPRYSNNTVLLDLVGVRLFTDSVLRGRVSYLRRHGARLPLSAKVPS